MKKFFAACAVALVSLTAILPTAAAEPRIVYEENFDTVTEFDQLGWEKMGSNATSTPLRRASFSSTIWRGARTPMW